MGVEGHTHTKENCICGSRFKMPYIMGDNGDFVGNDRIMFTWVCEHCQRTVQIFYALDEVRFYQPD
jgi:hypothetical protein